MPYEYSRINSVNIYLNGFRASEFNGPPHVIEDEVAQLARAILQPGYATKENYSEKCPDIEFSETDPQENQGNGLYLLPSETAICSRSPSPDTSAFCEATIRKTDEKVDINFLAAGGFLRRVQIKDKSFLEACEKYAKAQTEVRKIIQLAKKGIIFD